MKKTVVITGASSASGRATALGFAREGANLVLAGPSRPRLEEVAFECFDLGATPHVVVADLASPAAMQQVAHEAAEAFGDIDEWSEHAEEPSLPLAGVGAALALIALAWWGLRPALRARLAKEKEPSRSSLSHS